jgi:hypothetical protein
MRRARMTAARKTARIGVKAFPNTRPAFRRSTEVLSEGTVWWLTPFTLIVSKISIATSKKTGEFWFRNN